MTNIGKPYEGKPHVRFDEEGLGRPALYSSPNGQDRGTDGKIVLEQKNKLMI